MPANSQCFRNKKLIIASVVLSDNNKNKNNTELLRTRKAAKGPLKTSLYNVILAYAIVSTRRGSC